MFGIEILDRFHQADVALLDEIERVFGRARELERDLHHQAQIRGDEAIRVGRISLLDVTARDYRLFLAGQQREAANLGQVAAERIDRDDRAGIF